MWENFLLLCLAVRNYSCHPVEEEERRRKQVIDLIFMGRLIQAIQALIGSVLTALFSLREGDMPPSLCPWFAEEKQESGGETKG